MSETPPRFTCPKAAVFSDIHSNYHAFRACFEDAKAQNADLFIFLGDFISDLAEPRKTMDLLYEIKCKHPTFCLRGNRERYMLEHSAGISTFARGSKSGSLLFTFDQLQQRDLDFFGSLPIYGQIEINSIRFEVAHAAKDNDRCYFESGDDRIKDIFAQMDADYLLTGHSHRQYIQSCGRKTIINPGSIGVPIGANGLSQYALLEVCGEAVRCTLRSVPYDMVSTVHAQFKSGLVDYAKYWAISVLHDVITGEEHTMRLLERVFQLGDIHDEENWHKAATELDMKFTEKEIADLYDKRLS